MATAAVRQLSSIFLRFERDKTAFVSAVADAARVEGNAGALATLDAPRLLLPLLTDPSDTVAHTAAFALGRIAGHSRAVAVSLSSTGVVGTLVARTEAAVAAAAAPSPDAADAAAAAVAAKRSLMGMLVALMRHSPELAAAAAAQGGLAAAVQCLSDNDAESRECAASALAHLVAHSPELASSACTAGALPPLVACLSTPASAPDTAATRRFAASALSDSARHSPDLAAAVVAAGAVGAAASQLRAPLANDARLKRLLLSMLMYVTRADVALAEKVVAAGLIPDISRCLKFSDDIVRQGAARCLRDVARHTPALAAAMVDAPGLLDTLASFAAASPSVQALPALLAFGFAAEHSAELAAGVAAAPGVMPALVAALHRGDESSQAAAAWTLGRIGGHGASLAQAAVGSLPRLSELAASAPEGSDLQAKCLKAASAIISQLVDLAALAALVQNPALLPALQELVLARCAAIMAKAPASRTLFVTSGALGYLESRAEVLPPGSPATEQIAACLRLFPQELLQHFSASHAAKLLASLSSDPPPCDAIAAVRVPDDAKQPAVETAAAVSSVPTEAALPAKAVAAAVNESTAAAEVARSASRPACAGPDADAGAVPAAAQAHTGGEEASASAAPDDCTTHPLASVAVDGSMTGSGNAAPAASAADAILQTPNAQVTAGMAADSTTSPVQAAASGLCPDGEAAAGEAGEAASAEASGLEAAGVAPVLEQPLTAADGPKAASEPGGMLPESDEAQPQEQPATGAAPGAPEAAAVEPSLSAEQTAAAEVPDAAFAGAEGEGQAGEEEPAPQGARKLPAAEDLVAAHSEEQAVAVEPGGPEADPVEEQGARPGPSAPPVAEQAGEAEALVAEKTTGAEAAPAAGQAVVEEVVAAEEAEPADLPGARQAAVAVSDIPTVAQEGPTEQAGALQTLQIGDESGSMVLAAS